MFYDRQNELKRLNERYVSQTAQLLVIYGRRRVGKTALLKKFIENKPHIYYLADLSSEKEQLESFSERIQMYSGDRSLINNPFSSWGALFAYLGNLAQKSRLVVVIDEYQYLQTSNKAISSLLQKSWDEYLKDSKIFLVLCGSYVSFIEKELLAYKSPLYGRRTGQFLINPLSFSDAVRFFPDYDAVAKISVYGILGGIPAYLQQFNPKWSIKKNILRNILQPDAFLYNEPQFLLMQELREPRNYFAILKAIALGHTRINDIVQTSGLERGLVVKYLETLRNLRIVQREIPVQETQPEKSRRGLYEIDDFFFRFWFRFVFPHRGFIEEGREDFVLNEKIIPQLNQYLGTVFEEICLQFLKKKNRMQALPFEAQRLGRFWQNHTEIDVVGFDVSQKNMLVAECKWSNKKVGTNILNDLRQKTAHPFFKNAQRIYYFIFSKSGFTDSLKKENDPNLFLIDLNDMMSVLLNNTQSADK